MGRNMKSILFWSPRVLGILFAMFLSVFALDVFGESLGFWKTILALLMHLIPVYIVIIALIIAWRWEWVGAILFSGLGILYIYLFRGGFPLITYLIISGPLFLVGILFLLNWRYREQLRK